MLNSRLLVALLLRHTGAEPRDEVELLQTAAAERLDLVLASAWRSEGRDLAPELEARVETAREQAERYRSAARHVATIASDARVVKGDAIGRLYPEEWVRDTSDLDLQFEQRSSLWLAATRLKDDGWRPQGFGVVRVDDDLELVLSMTREREGAGARRENVELSSMAFLGDPPSVPPARRVPPRAQQVVALIGERFEQPFRARDVLDVVLLLHSMDADGSRELEQAIRLLSVEPEAVELNAKVRRSLRDAVALPVTAGARPVIRVRARRRLRAVRNAPFLARAAAETAHAPRFRGYGTAVARTVYRALPPRSALEHGLPLHGLLFDTVSASSGVELVDVDRQLVARTPIGTFLLIHGHFADERWLREVQAALAAATT